MVTFIYKASIPFLWKWFPYFTYIPLESEPASSYIECSVYSDKYIRERFYQIIPEILLSWLHHISECTCCIYFSPEGGFVESTSFTHEICQIEAFTALTVEGEIQLTTRKNW